MTSATTGECCVCGLVTETRCGTCEEAGFDLFFCSKEHQKLIWPVHKRVCGPGKANPFTWPDLTKEEADEMKANLKVQIYKGDTAISLEHVLTRSGIGPKRHKRTLAALSQPCTGTFTPTRRQWFLRFLRTIRPLSLEDVPQPTLPTHVHQRCALFATTYFGLAPIGEDHVRSQEDEPDSTHPSPSWRTPLLHKLLVCKALEMHLLNMVGGEATESELAMFLTRAERDLRDFLLDRVAQDCPSGVREYLEADAEEEDEEGQRRVRDVH